MPTKTNAAPKPDAAQPAPQIVPPAQPRPQEPSEYALLNRALDRSEKEELSFMRDLLEKWAAGPLSVQEFALGAASGHFHLGIPAEDITESYAAILRCVSWLRLHNDWLFRLLSLIAAVSADGRKLTPDDVMKMVGDCLTELNVALRVTSEMLAEYPGLIAADIQKAAAALKGENHA